ncbi:MAG: hypothetical protein LWW95_11360 [Candidatus Desulfofervidus auxilii]|nr:hypothetical protein [Candidatus Desulfofervidus auxilii]
MKKVFNPWKISTLSEEDYIFLKKYFNLSDFNFDLRDKPIFSKRNVILGHDNFDVWLKAANEGKKVALVSGFMTSGCLHIGSLTILKQMAYYQQKYNATIFIPLADLEAICVRKVRKEYIDKIIIEFLSHFYAAGLDLEKCVIYLQTQNVEVLRRAIFFTSNIELKDMERIYDRKMSLGEVFSSLVMVSDILYPQTLSYEKTLITLGIDEISHFMLTKELVKKLGYDFPSITYNKMITGLQGSKMGKSIPKNSILLTDSPETIKQKLNSLRDKNFPLVRNCAFNILQWFCEDDSIIKEITEEKEVKVANNLAIEHAIEVTKHLLKQHQKRYEEFLEKAEEIAPTLYGGS